MTGERRKQVRRKVKEEYPKGRRNKDERQDENKEETMEDWTGIDRARRRETKADTERSRRGIEYEGQPKMKEETDGRQGISKIAEKQMEVWYVAEKDDKKDDEKTIKRWETERH